uniref:Uncharacterized protein n=1 Tax=Ananas comosus var. bracteatus TaxID=296719 RepID=A0A6V7PP66_ANACO|nr:unnamed protein product [Ananas comosus var. bracteatus]
MQTRFVRPLFIRALIEGRPVSRVIVDGGAMVNVMPTSFYKKSGKNEDELKLTDTIMTDFTSNSQQAKGVLTTELTVYERVGEVGSTIRRAYAKILKKRTFRLRFRLEGRGDVQRSRERIRSIVASSYRPYISELWIGGR